MAWRLGAAVCGVLLAATSAPGQHKADLANGRRLAETRCARCHAIGLEDASPMPEAPPFRDLDRRYPVDDLAEALAEGIVTGHPEMPEFTFGADEIADFLGYLKSLR
jgi:mono/diheme cytochrome c family protein